jgi:hypothetical protein
LNANVEQVAHDRNETHGIVDARIRRHAHEVAPRHAELPAAPDKPGGGEEDQRVADHGHEPDQAVEPEADADPWDAEPAVE